MQKLPLNFDISTYDFSLYEWYNPVFILVCYHDLMSKYPGKEDHYLFKKANEAAQASISSLGVRALHEDNVYVLQMNRQSQRPDVIAAARVIENGEPIVKVSPLEITEMEPHTNHEDISKFLLEKKLKKNYPSETIFICMVNKVLKCHSNEIANAIRTSGKKNAIYIVGQVEGPENKFFIASPQPIIAQVVFDLAKEGTEYPYPYRMSLSEDRTNKSSGLTAYPAKPIDLFDFFMLDRKRIEKTFGKV